MSGKNKYRHSWLTQFFRYKENKLSGEERNSFERELQKDPFAEEASEGLSSLLSESASDDINDLKKRLRARTTGSQSFVFYRIAASIAAIVAISALVFLIEKSKNRTNIAQNELIPPAFEIPKTEPLNKPEKEVQSAPATRGHNEVKVPENQKSQSITEQTSKTEPTKDHVDDAEVAEEKSDRQLNARNVNAQSTDSIADQKNISALSQKADESIASSAGAMPRERSLKKAEPIKELKASAYNPPEPSTGKTEFDKYIRNNIVRPDSLTDQTGLSVVVTFLIRKNGNIDSLRIISSPGKVFSDEAIRLIKNGPSWRSAEENGNPLDDIVRLKITFR